MERKQYSTLQHTDNTDDKLVFHTINSYDQRIIHDVDVSQKFAVIKESAAQDSLGVLAEIEWSQVSSCCIERSAAAPHWIEEPSLLCTRFSSRRTSFSRPVDWT